MFNSKKLAFTWEKLHKKKCEICAKTEPSVTFERDIVYKQNRENTMKADAYRELEQFN